MSRTRRRVLIGVVAAAVVLGPLAWFWQQSLLPSSYSVMTMGYMDYGGGPHRHHGETSVADLVETDDRPADVTVDLVTRQQKVTLASGRTIDGYTVNGTTPGPQITATVGDMVEVHLTNASVRAGVSMHWHGVNVPNAEDGVAGVTQDAVAVGDSYTYRFVVHQVGTFWYHSHQVSHEQVLGGLFGPLVILPRDGIEQDADVVGVAHTYDGYRTISGREGVTRVPAKPGDRIRIRAVNTDNGTMAVWASGPYRVLAIDGGDLHGPTPVDGRTLMVPAAARADLEVVVPATGAIRVQLGAATAYVVGPVEAPEPARPKQPTDDVDLLTYGTPAPLPFDVDHPDRTFTYSIGRRPGLLDGRPGMWWTINGHLYPDVPMFVVREGDVVVVSIENHSGTVHPMHLHGHHAVVLSRDGTPSRGSPVWIDSVDVADDETVKIAFLADNPGIWMDHCHNLPHATQGLVSHLMYAGVTTPYRVGDASGNEPE